MRGCETWARSALLAALLAGPSLAEDLTIAGHTISVTNDGMEAAFLIVDGDVLLEAGAIYLDDPVHDLAGLAVATGVAGPGGNACAGAPFVLSLPEGGAARLDGPLDTCREFTVMAEEDRLVLSTPALPDEPGAVWVWTPAQGLKEEASAGFASDPGLGWDNMGALAGMHPADAMRFADVLAQVEGGLGADYPVFAERISDLGSGDLAPGGYAGQACLKYTCEADWAILYLHQTTRQAYAIWHVEGDIEPRIWPRDTNLWPQEAMDLLRSAVSE